MQEILVVIAIAAAIFFLPRLMGRKSSFEAQQQPRLRPGFQSQPDDRVPKIRLTGWMRLSIVVTFLWVAGCAAFLKPWGDNTFLFFLISLGPAIALWGGIWAWFGYKKYRR